MSTFTRRSVLFFVMFVTACGSNEITPTVTSPTPTETTSTKALIRVEPSGQIKKEISVLSPFVQPNCGGSAMVTNEIERSRSIQRTIEVGGGLSVNASGEIGIPIIGGVNVGAEIAANYGVTYGSQETIRRNLIVAAKEGTNMQHVAREVEIWETGDVVIQVAGQTFRYPYSFRKEFGVELVSSKDLGCPTPTPKSITVISLPDSSQVTPTAMPPTATTPPLPTVVPTKETASNSASNSCLAQLRSSSGSSVITHGGPEGTIYKQLDSGTIVIVTSKEDRNGSIWYAITDESGFGLGWVEKGLIVNLTNSCLHFSN